MKKCENCGADFPCEADTQKKCWCMELPVASNSSAKFKDCLCPQCLKIFMQPDFYDENGLMVFTEKFLLERGYCCHSGCRHCPYPK